ncbi:hypothetical protein ACRAWD_23950 [Caulobacter segnis]
MAITALAEQMEDGALAMERRLAGGQQSLRGSLRDLIGRLVRRLCSAADHRRLREDLSPCRS